MTAPLTRRAILRGTVYTAAGAAVGSQFLFTSAHAAGKGPDPRNHLDAFKAGQERARKQMERTLAGIRSTNGWEMEKVADNHGNIYTRPVPGTPVNVQVQIGDVELVLVHVIRRFHYEIETLLHGDVVGWRAPGTVKRRLAESNQASGTAVRIRPGHYPAGARGGFFPQQEIVIRDVLAELDGVVRWGGDDQRPDESLFHIDVRPGDARLAEVAAKVRAWNEEPSRGAGSGVDVFASDRRRRATKLARRQRSGG